MQLFSIIFTCLFLIVLIIYLFIASKRNNIKNIFCFLTNILTFVITFIITKFMVLPLGSKLTPSLSSIVKKALNITAEEWTKSSSIDLVTKFIINITIGIISFFIIFMVLYIINHILKRLVFKIIYKEKYSNYENDTQHNKIINVLIGLGSFAIITFVLFYPIGTMFKIIIDSARVVDFKFTEEGKILFNNPIIRVYANNGSEYLFNQITETKDEENNKVINTTTEFKSVITMSIAAVGIENATNVNENTNEIKNAFNEAYIAPTFISELCSNAANRWKNNKPFMGQTIELPNDSSREIYIDLLDIVSKWEREDLLNNIDTIFDFYDILMRYDIIKQDNQTDLVNALTDEKFDEELFLCLLHNKDLRFVIASFMNYGLKESLATLDVDIDVDYVETAKIMKMTDEEIKKEAQIFSVAVRQIVKIGKAINDNSPFTKEEYQEIMSNLSKIKDSKLLNDSLYKAMNKLLKIYNQ